MPFIAGPSMPRVFGFGTCPLGADGVACVTTREVPADKHWRRLPDARFLKGLRLSPGSIAWVRQVHGSRILASTLPGEQGRADSLITDRADIALLIRTADCLPVFLVDPETGALGLAHAGWRGAAARVASKTVGALVALYGCRPSRLWAGIGPGIGVCCYEVGEDVARSFAPDHVVREGSRWRCDLAGAVAADLVASGVSPKQIERADLCTACHPELFHSYRREKTSDRLFSLLARFSSSTRA